MQQHSLIMVSLSHVMFSPQQFFANFDSFPPSLEALQNQHEYHCEYESGADELIDDNIPNAHSRKASQHKD
jgi:hypothetical protein